MQDKEETVSEWWLELEGEAEMPEVTVLWIEAEGVSVNLEGESHQEQTRSKKYQKGKRRSSKNGKKGRSKCW